MKTDGIEVKKYDAGAAFLPVVNGVNLLPNLLGRINNMPRKATKGNSIKIAKTAGDLRFLQQEKRRGKMKKSNIES